MWDAVGGIAGAVGSYFGNRETNAANERIAAQNIAVQREFAQHGVRWKVADAQAAGIHPLAALGAQTSSFSPVSVGHESNADAYSKMGQSLGRAVKAAMEKEERADHDAEHARRLSIEKQGIENNILKTRLASDVMRTSREAGQIGPPIPMPRPGPARSFSGVALEEDKMKQKEESAPTVRSLPIWGLGAFKTHPGRASASDIEQEYGDEGPVPMLLNTGNFITDVFHNMGQSGPWTKWTDYWNKPVSQHWSDRLRGGDRSRYSRAARRMRGGD